MDKRIALAGLALTLGVSEVKGMPVYDAIEGFSSDYAIPDNSWQIREAYQNGERDGRAMAKDDYKTGMFEGFAFGLKAGVFTTLVAVGLRGIFRKRKKDNLWPPNQPLIEKRIYSVD